MRYFGIYNKTSWIWGVLIAAISLPLSVHFNLEVLLLTMSNATALIFCYLIEAKKMGLKYSLTAHLCAVNGKFNCDKVIEKGNIYPGLALSDLGIIYSPANSFTFGLALASRR